MVVDLGHREVDLGLQASSFEPNVLVLTHDDADHVGGATAFFGAYRHLAGTHRTAVNPPEVWLPLDWFHVVQALARLTERPNRREDEMRRSQVEAATSEAGPIDEDTGALRMLLGDAHERRNPPASEEPIAQGLFDEVDQYPEVLGLPEEIVWGVTRWFEHERGDIRPWDEKFRPTQFRGEARDRISTRVEPVIKAHRKVISAGRQGAGKDSWLGSHGAVAQRVAESAERIAGIVLAADEIGCRFRWFDVDLASARRLPCWPSEGRPGLVTILNAIEVEPPPPPPTDPALALTLAARLSVQNRRALVTYLWPTAPSPYDPWDQTSGTDGVLIWSDAEGSVAGCEPTTGMVPWRTVSVMSAPHHASSVSAHEAIWRHRPPNIKVILSNNKEPDSPYFLSLPTALRDCTHCGARRHDTPVGGESASWPPADGVLLAGVCSSTHR
ncbi:hypothetical protein [Kribbella sancticallisti]|uniref:hypothetical protein n=1 Tax=Kribbella sancticallisti TaxID=460087 RepID=UPI0031D0C334